MGKMARAGEDGRGGQGQGQGQGSTWVSEMMARRPCQALTSTCKQEYFYWKIGHSKGPKGGACQIPAINPRGERW